MQARFATDYPDVIAVEFELWEFTDQISRCFAVRPQDQVDAKYHDMFPGDCRVITETAEKVMEIHCRAAH
jgi:hypothetical protein